MNGANSAHVVNRKPVVKYRPANTVPHRQEHDLMNWEQSRRAICCAALVLAAASAAAAAAAEPFTLKGYALRQDMPECPTDAATKARPDGTILCTIDGGTIAGEPSPYLGVLTHEGKVTMVNVRLAERGQTGNAKVLAALREKFGAPTNSEKAHLNRYVWRQGKDVLIFNGWDGTLTLLDGIAGEAITKREAKQKSGDL